MPSPRVKTEQSTFALLYSSVAGICKVDMPPTLLTVISVLYRYGKDDPLTVQNIAPLLALQVKVAVDPSVALTDVGGMMNSEI